MQRLPWVDPSTLAGTWRARSFWQCRADSRTMRRHPTIVPGRGLLVLLVALWFPGCPTPSAAQVFLASEPRPQFEIGPLFVSATVNPKNIGQHPASVMVTVSWSLVFPGGRTGETTAGDLYLLWPAEVEVPAGGAPAD